MSSQLYLSLGGKGHTCLETCLTGLKCTGGQIDDFLVHKKGSILRRCKVSAFKSPLENMASALMLERNHLLLSIAKVILNTKDNSYWSFHNCCIVVIFRPDLTDSFVMLIPQKLIYCRKHQHLGPMDNIENSSQKH